MVDSIVNVLMRRDGLTREEAVKAVDKCRTEGLERIGQGDYPWGICAEHFGLEGDYLDELFF